MKSFQRMAALILVCIFAVTGGLGAFAAENGGASFQEQTSSVILSDTSSGTSSEEETSSSQETPSSVPESSSDSSSQDDTSNSVSSQTQEQETVPSGQNSLSLESSAVSQLASANILANTLSEVQLSYQTHVQTYGWQNWVAGGTTSGTTGEAKRLEAIQIKTSASSSQGGIRYRTHVQSYGWQDWVSDGASSGTTGEAKRLEAIQIELTGDLANQYDVYYRTHVQTYGWLDWAKNGESAGTAGYAKRMEAIEIVLVPKGGDAPGSTASPYREAPTSVTYQTYLSGKWQGTVSDKATSGSVGQATPIEGIQISLKQGGFSLSGSGIQYRTHLQTYGWQDWSSNGATSGRLNSGKRMEAIQIQLTGPIASEYDIYYRTHVQTYGWLDWAKNGESSGTAGYAKRIEAVQIVLVPKGGSAPGKTATPYHEAPASAVYQTYVSGSWQSSVSDQATSGILDKGKKVEGLKISLKQGGQALGDSAVNYRVYLQSYRWQPWVSNGGSSGQIGSGKRMEAIEINLSGPAADLYDIYYRSYVTGFGWLGWAKNGGTSGTTDYAAPIEGVQIVLVSKGGQAPGSTEDAYLGNYQVSLSPSGHTTLGGLMSVEPNQSITLNASASGGAGDYQYRYRVEMIGGSSQLTGEQILQDYTTASSISWQSGNMGHYRFSVDVKDAKGTVKTASFQLSVGYNGIDISTWQGKGTITSWQKVKNAGIDYVIMRLGFGYRENGAFKVEEDNAWQEHLSGTQSVGLPFGFYFYSGADSVEEAEQEAEFVVDLLQEKGLEPEDVSYPIAFDIEEQDRLSVSQRRLNTDMAKAFCDIIREAGYMPMVYASKSVFQSYLYYDELQANNIWMAAYTTTPSDTTYFDNCFPVEMWQYTSSGVVDGISGNVDLNISYTTAFKDGSQESGQGNQGRVINIRADSYLTVRSGPGESNPEISRIYNGDLVTILGETDGWYQITTASGITGYVSAQYIQRI